MNGVHHSNHHEMMILDFRRRFYISLILTIPILIPSEIIQNLFNHTLEFQGVELIQVILSSIIFFYGGVPFFTGARDELKKRLPGMMTLVTLAISISYLYSVAVVFFLSEGKPFFWEPATLVDIMLIGHWMEMKSVVGASKALQTLAALMPSEAHLLSQNGDLEEIPTSQLQVGDNILVRPGEKFPATSVFTSYLVCSTSNHSKIKKKNQFNQVI